jgi:hypothetical protein
MERIEFPGFSLPAFPGMPGAPVWLQPYTPSPGPYGTHCSHWLTSSSAQRLVAAEHGGARVDSNLFFGRLFFSLLTSSGQGSAQRVQSRTGHPARSHWHHIHTMVLEWDRRSPCGAFKALVVPSARVLSHPSSCPRQCGSRRTRSTALAQARHQQRSPASRCLHTIEQQGLRSPEPWSHPWEWPRRPLSSRFEELRAPRLSSALARSAARSAGRAWPWRAPLTP